VRGSEIRIQPLTFPFVCPGERAVRGRIKSRPEDFVVEEVPAYEPCGAGEHLYVRLEKTGWAMERLLSHISRTLGLSQSETGYAGLKDKVSVSSQWLSLPARCESNLSSIESPQVRILEVSRHTNKLRIGHLKGNRFKILLRGAGKAGVEPAGRVLDAFSRNGMPNIYGNQRFGKNMEPARVGRDVVAGSMRISGMSRMKRKFVISAFQSYLFNLYSLLRLEEEVFQRC